VLDPIEALTFVAAHTSRIGLGTSVLDIPFYNPVTLARRLTSLDIFPMEQHRIVA
jgi:alkanesulfonate monooxygenase SsuD/methylene tetrahydromethanopterin reductase-like flavin-dependent oxidoreductase (luciferase family)